MTYFADLSNYEYSLDHARDGTKNVGWLAKRHPFSTAEPEEHTLDRLWRFCRVSVSQTRGVHECEFCGGGPCAVRRSEQLLLGTSEIRVFGKANLIYAAPTLIFHYVLAHKYRPPSEFLDALASGLAPPEAEYFDRLTTLGLDWRRTSSPDGARFRFVKNDLGELEKLVVPESDDE